MADIERLKAGFKAAHAAGDTDAATRFAKAIRASQGQKFEDQPTLDQRVEGTFGLEPNIERPGFLPMPSFNEGDTMTDFTAPAWVYEAARGVSMPKQALSGGDITEEDITRGALGAFAPFSSQLKPMPKRTPNKLTRSDIRDAPTTDQLKAAGKEKYNAAKKSNVVINSNSFDSMVDGMGPSLKSEGFAEGLHPKASTALNEIAKYKGSDIDAQELSIIRRLAKSAKSSLDKDEVRIGGKMVTYIDDYLRRIGVDDVAPKGPWGPRSSDPKKYINTLKEGDALWTKANKSKIIDDMIENASNAASGEEMGLRNAARALLKQDVKKNIFNKTERDALKKVAQGTAGVNLLRTIGKFGPTSEQQSKAMMPYIGGAGAYALGGVPGMLALGAGGNLAAQAAKQGTKQAASTVRALTSGAKPRAYTPSSLPYQGLLGMGEGAAAGGAIPPYRKDRKK